MAGKSPSISKFKALKCWERDWAEALIKFPTGYYSKKRDLSISLCLLKFVGMCWMDGVCNMVISAIIILWHFVLLLKYFHRMTPNNLCLIINLPHAIFYLLLLKL